MSVCLSVLFIFPEGGGEGERAGEQRGCRLKREELTLSYSVFIANKWLRTVSPLRVSLLLKKNAVICSQRAMLPIQSGMTTRCRHVVMAG